MTIDEAIKHCEEVAAQKDHESFVDRWSDDDEWSESVKENCRQCAADHRQLAEWLTELKERRATKRGEWCPPLMGQGKCSTHCSRCFGTVMRNSTGIFEETPFCPHCGADMRKEN